MDWMKRMLKYYTRQTVWTLFLLCAFPLHLWTLFLSFRDVSWLTARTSLWDTVGVISYGLVFALFESLLLFTLALIAGFLVSLKWDANKRVALIGILFMIVGIWSAISQLFSIFTWSLPIGMVNLITHSGHPVRNLYSLLLIFVVPSLIIPTYAILQSSKAYSVFADVIDRLSLLTIVYLAFDVLAFGVVILRNI